MDVTIEDAYREACLALGESIVHGRLMAAQVAALRDQATPEAAEPDPTA